MIKSYHLNVCTALNAEFWNRRHCSSEGVHPITSYPQINFFCAKNKVDGICFMFLFFFLSLFIDLSLFFSLYPTRCSFSFIFGDYSRVLFFFLFFFLCSHSKSVSLLAWIHFGDISKGFMIVHVIFLLYVLSLVKLFPCGNTFAIRVRSISKWLTSS